MSTLTEGIKRTFSGKVPIWGHNIGKNFAGSVFKNPKEQAAGYLLDQAGLKGMKVGGAEISTHHANFFVNHGDAKSADIAELIRIARKRVYKKFKIKLDLEVKTIGFNQKDLDPHAS